MTTVTLTTFNWGVIVSEAQSVIIVMGSMVAYRQMCESPTS